MSERSKPKIGWSGEQELPKSDGAERSAEREVAVRKWSGERGAEVTEISWLRS